MARPRVAVAMSGGVDSSVACLILRTLGFDVVGLTMKLLPSAPGSNLNSNPCCTIEMAEDARKVCNKLGIPHYTVNLVEEFEAEVILPFIRQYAQGSTPNPCLACNRAMKFGHLLKKAREIGADYIATGHYARVGQEIGGEFIENHLWVKDNGPIMTRVLLKRGVDRSKDQSYALYPLTQDMLSSAMFPLGSLTKSEVRKIARDAGLPTAFRPESQEICFVDGDYREFLMKRGISAIEGPILDTSGKLLGKHRGIMFYTIGQRQGLGIGGTRPLYVVDIDRERNAVIVGSRQEAYSRGCVIEDVNLIALDDLAGPERGTFMVRYRGKEVDGTLGPVPGRKSVRSGDEAEALFDEPQFAVTPGQALVMYQGDVVFAGGTICRRVA